ncbi:Transcriptional regulator of acetoin/glycerol metabolism [Pseudoxanthobacter soli DSM 19599]|uniref:Transcriptional regulator of acetoin/glycerol metabolism n=1 Tax=Pseudoxanthobacter soli DSM 19599 TaxID=1123029 RepID=A0A1M7ZNN8_9HYPH|nr:sigma-54-dependent Fis family transcriptional regulator [Pseudoxanthobacter soli]SHO66518.1 Transcriptional regulator of acetoin/glycerol metabolism [Pseudoxanthobacter soli DSM 19599]
MDQNADQIAIRRAWETFLTEGRRPPSISPALASSWERSRTSGVVSRLTEAPLSGEPEVHRRRRQSAALLAAARPALTRSHAFLGDASSMMILSDATGFIVETAGDPRVIDNGRRNHLETGGRWEEAAIGTNAIGTALVERRAIQVRGAAHYCEDVQRWTCAATPVCHPIGGELLGVVDISGPMTSFNPQSLALAVAIGQEIEAQLGRVAEAEHEELLRRFLSKRSMWLSEEMLVVDRRGVLVHGTRHVRQKLDAASPEGLASDVHALIGRAESTLWEENCRRRFPNASLEVVRVDGEAIGCIILMHNKARAGGGPSATPATLPSAAEPFFGFDEIVGDCPAMEQAREKGRKLARNALPVLIEGETGVGKELFARAIKCAGPRVTGPFVPLNCGGMPRDLIASELFGYARGAFTGADEKGRAGRIEKADGGVLCLDEIGEMPLDLQSYLLRVLEDGVVYRIGDHEPRQVDIRIVSMTNRDLSAEVEAGRFRRDLYYRIAAVRLAIPPLRERGEDIVLLAARLGHEAAMRLGRPPPRFSPSVLDLFRSYPWPGNVRELRNVVDAMVALADGDVLDLADVPADIRRSSGRPEGACFAASAPSTPPAPPLAPWPAVTPAPYAMPASRREMQAAERAAILAQVEAAGGNLAEAARRLGIARSTLYLKLARYRDESDA